jgi:hypothetical protein
MLGCFRRTPDPGQIIKRAVLMVIGAGSSKK